MTASAGLALQAYARSIRTLLRADPSAAETALAPAFQSLLHALLPQLPAVPPLTIAPEYLKPGIGRPDIALIRPGQPARAFIELKAPAKPADPARWRSPHDLRQFGRLQELGHWATSNFVDFHLFGRAQPQGSARIVPPRALQPDTPDRAADALIAAHDPDDFLALLGHLGRADAPEARTAANLAELMAHAARIVRSGVEERIAELRAAPAVADPLLLVRSTFKDVLYAHPEAGGYAAADFDTLFASAFAQTLAFGLLLVREATGQPVAEDAWRQMPDEHPLMKAALRVLSDDEVKAQIGIGYDVMRDCVNSFAPEILRPGRDGRDPILYFYEDFLQTFDRAARDRYGVYYTPVEVVRYMVAALDRALRERLGTAGLRDREVTILDPATGTGTFLLGVAERVRDAVLRDQGGPAAAVALGNLAGRMFGFELLVGPYAVAHYRLHHALRFRPPDEDEDSPQPVNLPRLGIYLADTLSEPDAAPGTGRLGIAGIPIDDERARANEIKARQQVLAIIGNPPYKRLEEGETDTLVGRWMSGLWDDLKGPVRDAGQGGQLNTFPESSVAFWRWAMWKLFEAQNAPQRGVVAFITNRKFLTGWPYAGLRRMMRQRFDRIEVIDLRGDVRTGARADVARDQGVFNIKVGTCITLAIADGSKADGALAEVVYTDAWKAGRFSRKSKLEWLTLGSWDGATLSGTTIDRPELEDWRRKPFEDGQWLSLREVFSFSLSGLQTKRDHFAYAPNNAVMANRIERFLSEGSGFSISEFAPTGARPIHSAKLALQSVLLAGEKPNFVQSGYRPLDLRTLCNHKAVLDRDRPDLQECWGQANSALYTMPFGVSAGPGVWCHGLLPDYHAFSGRGGYAFPLYDRRKGPTATNLAPALLAALSLAYGRPVSAEAVFDAMLCLLSASSYTRRFAEDLEDTFPHVPFPADPAVFAAAAALGARIRAIETFAAPPDPAFCAKAFGKLASEPTGPVGTIAYADGALALCDDGSGRMTGLPAEVWGFAISGYRVLPRWIEARKGLPAAEVWEPFRDVAARIHELIQRFDEADLVLESTLADSLTRDELGFPAPAAEPTDQARDGPLRQSPDEPVR